MIGDLLNEIHVMDEGIYYHRLILLYIDAFPYYQLCQLVIHFFCYHNETPLLAVS